MNKAIIPSRFFVGLIVFAVAGGCAAKDPTLEAAPTPAPGASVVPVEGRKDKQLPGMISPEAAPVAAPQ